MATDDWPFRDPRNTSTATTVSVMQRGAPVLLVQHLTEGEGWTFLDGQPFEMNEALLVTLGSVVELDPSVQELSDMPEGWVATRERAGAPWRRQRDEE